MISPTRLQKLAKEHGTPLFVIDHDALRKNYRQFRRYLPRIQIYYAVKANPDPAIVRTLYQEGASFDVASMPEFMIVHENIKDLPAQGRQDWIWDKIIYANPTKATETLEQLNQYSRWSPSTTWRRSGRSSSTRPTRGWRCASKCRTPAQWSSCRRSLAPRPAKPLI